MDKLDFSNDLIFDKTDLTPPKHIVENLIAELKEATKGIIEGVITNYDGPIEPYKKVVTKMPLPGLTAITSALSSSLQPQEEIVEVDIQNNLGKTGDTLQTFEFYITTPVFQQYQYRICFLQHGVANYPVKVVLEQSVADEINKRGLNSTCTYTRSSPSELEELLFDIIYSKKLKTIMQELINVYNINKPSEDE